MQEIRDKLRNVTGLLKERYRKIDEISSLTDDLDEALKRNDSKSVEIVMSMRGKEMDEIDIINDNVNSILRDLPEEYQRILKEAELGDLPVDELSDIIDVKKRSQRLLENIIKKDREINTRIGGDNSFYKEK